MTASSTDRVAIVNHIKEYLAKYGVYPTLQALAQVADVPATVAGSVLRQVKATGEAGLVALPPSPRERAVMDTLVSYMTEHCMPPSQREIADATGFSLNTVNETLWILRQRGLIDVGPGARTIRIVGAKMVIPEVSL